MLQDAWPWPLLHEGGGRILCGQPVARWSCEQSLTFSFSVLYDLLFFLPKSEDEQGTLEKQELISHKGGRRKLELS